ncbi:MAG: hypothetical protein IPM55_21390 [Acidobacteria bacterium]|nr:hypothetical protein [Acidobacteriota bacterium]
MLWIFGIRLENLQLAAVRFDNVRVGQMWTNNPNTSATAASAKGIGQCDTTNASDV